MRTCTTRRRGATPRYRREGSSISTPEAREIRELRDFATELAVAAGDVTLKYFGGIVDHDAKGDGSPVTIADKEAEQLIRSRIEARTPRSIADITGAAR